MTGEFAIAVHAIVYLNRKKTIVSSEMLAENICTNPARVRKIMAKLRKAGIVETKEGIEGGYYFERNSGKVSLREISEAMEVNFVSAGWKSGSQDMKCMVSSGMAGVMDDIYSELDGICKKRLEGISIKDIDEKIFKDKAAAL